IKKNNQKINTPGPETVLEAGDTLVVSGHRNQIKVIIKELLARRDG
ncbi:MAG: TrkA C-terminal domain-containing protein, partial [Bacillus sp. (in: firmicutes)]